MEFVNVFFVMMCLWLLCCFVGIMDYDLVLFIGCVVFLSIVVVFLGLSYSCVCECVGVI